MFLILSKLLKKLRVKEFDSDNISLSKFQPFHKGRVKIKKRSCSIWIKD